MAQAISERLLQRALGPVDLSYAYQKIDAVSRQLAAEDRLRKQEAAKQYYTEMASMNKDKAGIRAIDTPEISKQYSEWSNIGKKLSNNPTLITKNPSPLASLIPYLPLYLSAAYSLMRLVLTLIFRTVLVFF